MSQNKKAVKRVQYSITAIALIFLIIHLTIPSLSIDEITLILFIVTIIPWVLPLFKSIEFPGGWKLEFQDYEELVKKSKKIANDAINSNKVETLPSLRWDKTASLFWLGNDLMWIKDMTYRGAPPSKIIEGIDKAIKYAHKLGFSDDSLPIKNLTISKRFIIPLKESESSKDLDPAILANYYFNIQEYIEPVKWYISSLAEEQEPDFEKY